MKKWLIGLLLGAMAIYGAPAAAAADDTAAADADADTVQEEQTEQDGPLYQLKTEQHVTYIKGSHDRFEPNKSLTRGEAAKIICTLIDGSFVAPMTTFTDVPANAWYADSVNILSQIGIINGYGTEFRPESNMTRAEFVTILSRFFEPEPAEVRFFDVPDGYWGMEAIETGVKKGWIAGDETGAFRPDDRITRAEAVKVLNRVLGRSADMERIHTDGEILTFVDVPYTHWAYGEIMEAAVPHEFTKAENEPEQWSSYEIPQAEHGPGANVIDGELYWVSDAGHFIKNEIIGQLAFGTDGKYTTGNAKLDERLTELVVNNAVNTDDRSDSLYRLYRYVCTNYSYLPRAELEQAEGGWEPGWAAQMIEDGRGNCYSYAALFTMLARKMGYQAQGISGQVRTDSWSWDRHGWTQIELDGVQYLCDPEFEGVYVAGHGLGWDLFMKQYGTTPTRYSVNGVDLAV